MSLQYAAHKAVLCQVLPATMTRPGSACNGVCDHAESLLPCQQAKAASSRQQCPCCVKLVWGLLVQVLQQEGSRCQDLCLRQQPSQEEVAIALKPACNL